MLDEQKRKEIIAEYFRKVNEGDIDAILTHFTEDARIEDPVGREPRVGRAAHREYFHSNIAAEVTVAPGHASVGQDGKQVAVPVAATMTNILDPNRTRTNINAVDVFTINADGLIEDMRVFWGMSDIGV
ncbi:nuclear transport factor 2 family protein [Streptomyces sp. NBC_00091]|uniref:nuclear transport factor 2 family protein n=1 Tax=Streptomyces sp. NBC_00091 TaxID=2975648 RepID=UPI00225A43ED|nr:nuclear transport factor 2 family protein [Streptomyces sp. NBC_00091]MCX5381016.1 nuclear transport factor 2 family protein [Streptomyces sp. NBC_00091]